MKSETVPFADQLHRLQTVYDARFAREYSPWRPVVAQIADKFLACWIHPEATARVLFVSAPPRAP